jgi:hypothetical protein
MGVYPFLLTNKGLVFGAEFEYRELKTSFPSGVPQGL